MRVDVGVDHFRLEPENRLEREILEQWFLRGKAVINKDFPPNLHEGDLEILVTPAPKLVPPYRSPAAAPEFQIDREQVAESLQHPRELQW